MRPQHKRYQRAPVKPRRQVRPVVRRRHAAPNGMSVQSAPDTADQTGFERLIFFTDAVFAIAITLLIIDIHLPANAEANLAGSLRHLVPEFEGFVMSFLVIALYWMSHHRVFRYIRRYDAPLLWINAVLLMSIVFIPFSTSLISSYGDQALAVMFYALNLAVIGALFLLLWTHAAFRGNLVNSETPREMIRRTTVALAIPPVVFLISIPIATTNITMAEVTWLLIVLLRSVPARVVPDRTADVTPFVQTSL